MFTKSLNIDLFIPDHSIDGYMIATSHNWTGQCIKINRGNLDEISNKNDLKQKSGVYFLFGSEYDSNLVYIGESENVLKRVSEHLRDDKKAWFEDVVLVTTSNGFLTKGHIKRLEFELIALVGKSIQYKLSNDNRGSESSLPESLKSDIFIFIDYLKIIMPTLGFNIFPDDNTKSKRTDEITYVMSDKKGLYCATGIYRDGKFIVLAGSKIKEKETNSCDIRTKTNRNRLKELGIISDEYVFKDDYEFNSPSAAADVVFGGSQNGWTSWKNDTGTLDKVIRKNNDNAGKYKGIKQE